MQKLNTSLLQQLQTAVSSSNSQTPILTRAATSFTNTTYHTQDTTPAGDLEFAAFNTLLIPTKDLGSIKAIEHAFIEFEPFKVMRCAFCEGGGVTCKCQALATVNTDIPSTKKKLMKYLQAEEVEAGHIQAATLTYLLALEKHVPFGTEFNLDQQAKCGAMNVQLDQVKHRIADIKKAMDLLNDKDLVPQGILGACGFMRPVLANCLGNARENHICFKLNFKLFTK